MSPAPALVVQILLNGIVTTYAAGPGDTLAVVAGGCLLHTNANGLVVHRAWAPGSWDYAEIGAPL